MRDKASFATIDTSNWKDNVKINTIVDEFLNVQLPSKATINIYTLEGKVVASERLNNGQNIDCRNLTKGNYLVTIENNQDKITRKIIKR